MPNSFRLTLLATTVASLATSTALAQQSETLNNMVVTASGFEQQIKDAPASISVLSREQLERGHYQNITDALRDVPGVTVTGGGGGDNGHDISIRGMPAQYTLVLVDGRPQSSRESRPNGSAGFEQDWLPPLQAIERIEIVRGPMSTLYGSDAIGGVINVITRKVAQQWHGNLQVDTVLQESSSSGDSRQGNFYLSGPLVGDT
ncbi:TonB-dependent receptor plug domain-containing protein, partial [Halomonas sp. AOP43-D1-4]